MQGSRESLDKVLNAVTTAPEDLDILNTSELLGTVCPFVSILNKLGSHRIPTKSSDLRRSLLAQFLQYTDNVENTN
jgi:hypothetical protein